MSDTYMPCPKCGYRQVDPSVRKVTHMMNEYVNDKGKVGIFNEGLPEFKSTDGSVTWKLVSKEVKDVDPAAILDTKPSEPAGNPVTGAAVGATVKKPVMG